MTDDEPLLRVEAPRLRIGCAMWAHPPWKDRYGVVVGDELAWYGSLFESVEGNTTFYATPSPETVARWADTAPTTMRFCFKLPRHITHERRLRNVEEPVSAFLSSLMPLADRLGPVQVQLPASFGPENLDALLGFLDATPDHLDGAPLDWAVEVRHAEFYAGGRFERPLNDALAARAVNRVVLDSRALFAVAPSTREEHEAWANKPRLPVRPVATGLQPLIRLIGQSDPEATLDHWRRWWPKFAAWLHAGLSPHVFVHTPDNVAAPELAYRVRSEIADLIGGGIADRPEPRPSGQLDLWS